MKLRSFLHVAPILLACVAPLTAQWDSIPRDQNEVVTKGANLIAHKNATGIHAFSALTQQWTTVSPAGSTSFGNGDSYVLTRESPTSLRAWSARRNSSAVLTVGASISVLHGFGEVVMITDQSVVPGMLHAYSAMTNTWTSQVLGPNVVIAAASRFAVGVLEGNLYHAFSAYSGQWSTLAVGAPGGNPVANDNIVTANLFSGGAGVRQIAAYSAVRGQWQLSPPYSATIGANALTTNNLATMRAERPSPTQFSFAGFSAATGTWTTSPLVHNTGSTVSATAYHNVGMVTDTDPNARFEVFGAGTGAWLQLTGSSLSNPTAHEDFATIEDPAAQTLYATSALAGGGWATLTGGYTCSGFGDHLGLCVATGPVRYKAYSAANNLFTNGTVPTPPLNAVAGVSNGVLGIVGTGPCTAEAFSPLSGDWVPGPVITGSETYQAFTTGSMFVTWNNFTPNGYLLHVFDLHRSAWNTPFQLPPNYTFAVGANHVLAWPSSGSGTIYGYSAQRGDWTTLTTAGTLVNDGGVLAPFSNVVSFADSNGLLWAFSTMARLQATAQWPLSREYASAGPGPVGSTLPTLAFAMHGTPATEFGLVYAAFAVLPSPVAIPGFTGLLDVDPTNAFVLANLGVFDADGVLEAAIPMSIPTPGGLQVWLQALTLDLNSFQLGFAGRAAGTALF